MHKCLLVLLLTLFAGHSVFAGTDKFFQRFNLVRENGKLLEIRDRSLDFQFKIAPYISFIKKSLENEQNLMRSKGDYDYDIQKLFSNESNKSFADAENVGYIVRSMRELDKLDIDKVFNDPGFKDVVAKFESKIGNALKKMNLSVLANLQDPTYFYKVNVSYQIVKWALNFAKKRLSTIPILNTASYIIVRVERLIRERRTFHQNMLLHYFENFKEEELKMTKEEVDFAFSSIYESRIQWFAFWESQAAQATWNKYGVNNFFRNVRLANNRFRTFRDRYSVLGDKLNFAFREVEENEASVIINLFDSQDQFNQKPAIAFYKDNPKKVARKRLILKLAQLGMSFIPLPDFIKNFATKYMRSHYEQQALTEGSLYGYFEAKDDQQGQEDIRNQYLNPFDHLILE